ncbi:hypothetical protein [Antrihabitans stalactiti]|uniref:RiboL-PSP-HEPN domain-containing protein n=1 Tax=Antrihabitans stalactiti TaxID=2584121 RepID=A0A848KNF4_9NOCA|nr:hypothetical protein [Antrihabitans stalactiti]NMN99478.1 hypothetical protein [Antrihabitans stalactiti]
MTSDGEPSIDANVLVPTATAQGVAPAPVAIVVNNLSPQFLWSAQHFARLCAKRENKMVRQGIDNPDRRLQALAIAAILNSAMFLESLVNELFLEAVAAQSATQLSGRLELLGTDATRLLADDWNSNEGAGNHDNIFDKFHKALNLTQKGSLDTGNSTYGRAKMLIKLRSDLVHSKPAPESVGPKRTPKGAMEKKYPGIRLNRQNIGPFWPHKLLGAGVAQWSCETAEVFANEWLDTLDLPHDYAITLENDFPRP